jgi:hypothetical protein
MKYLPIANRRDPHALPAAVLAEGAGSLRDDTDNDPPGSPNAETEVVVPYRIRPTDARLNPAGTGPHKIDAAAFDGEVAIKSSSVASYSGLAAPTVGGASRIRNTSIKFDEVVSSDATVAQIEKPGTASDSSALPDSGNLATQTELTCEHGKRSCEVNKPGRPHSEATEAATTDPSLRARLTAQLSWLPIQ